MPSQNNFAASSPSLQTETSPSARLSETTGHTSPTPVLSPMAQAAAQERVSASELAAALAALETRRTTVAHFEAGTITVGEAIEQLNLDIAPSEVLTEVLAQREQKADELEARRKRRRERLVMGLFPILLIGCIVILVGLVLGRGTGAPATVETPARHEETRLFKPQTLRVRDKNVQKGGVTIRTLSEVENNRAVSVQSGDLMTQFALDPKDDFVSSTQSVSQSAEWTLIKHNGVAYLRGYVGAPMSGAALASGEVIVCNRPRTPAGFAIGPNPSPITFRLDTLRGTTDSAYQVGGTGNGASYSVSSDNWQRILLPGLKGDSHLWER